jgi:hypothetical protein
MVDEADARQMKDIARCQSALAMSVESWRKKKSSGAEAS